MSAKGGKLTGLVGVEGSGSECMVPGHVFSNATRHDTVLGSDRNGDADLCT